MLICWKYRYETSTNRVVEVEIWTEEITSNCLHKVCVKGAPNKGTKQQRRAAYNRTMLAHSLCDLHVALAGFSSDLMEAADC